MTTNEFKELFLPLSPQLKRFASGLLNNDSETEDIIQDVLFKLWEKRKALKSLRNPEAFAMTITRNKCLDILRKRKNLSHNESDYKIEINQTDKSLSSAYDNMERAKIVKCLISHLPEKQRTVIYLRDIEQYEFEEISRVTGFTPNYIRVNLSRARKTIKEELLKLEHYGTGEN